MKRLVYVLAVVVLVVLASGCTSNELSKTYSGNNVTFQYPGTWSENATFSNLTGSSVATAVAVGNDTQVFTLTSLDISSYSDDVKNSVLSTMVQTYKSANLTTEKTLTVDGVNATVLSSPDKIASTDAYVSIALWVKNDKLFMALYGSKDGSSTAIFEKILGTIKTT